MFRHDTKDTFAIGMILGFLEVFWCLIDFAVGPMPRIASLFSDIVDPPVRWLQPQGAACARCSFQVSTLHTFHLEADVGRSSPSE